MTTTGRRGNRGLRARTAAYTTAPSTSTPTSDIGSIHAQSQPLPSPCTVGRFAFAPTVPVNRMLIARGRGHVVMHELHVV